MLPSDMGNIRCVEIGIIPNAELFVGFARIVWLPLTFTL